MKMLTINVKLFMVINKMFIKLLYSKKTVILSLKQLDLIEKVFWRHVTLKVSLEIIDKKLGKPSFFLFRHLEKDAHIML